MDHHAVNNVRQSLDLAINHSEGIGIPNQRNNFVLEDISCGTSSPGIRCRQREGKTRRIHPTKTNLVRLAQELKA